MFYKTLICNLLTDLVKEYKLGAVEEKNNKTLMIINR